MTRPMKYTIAALIFIFGGLIGFNLFKKIMIHRFFSHYEPPAVVVSSVIAQERVWHPSIQSVGNFVALNGLEVNAQTAGNIVHIHFDSGQWVKAGQPLVDIDDQVEQATLKFNQAQLALRKINFQRQADLNARGAAPLSNVDEAKANLDQALANVEKTQAEINQKHITAAFSGRLGIRLVNLGQYITPGQTTIVTLQALDPLYLEFYLPEHWFKKLHVNQKVSVRVDELPDLLFEGRISAINAKVDANTHNIQIQALVPNCPVKAIQNPVHSPYIQLKQQKYSNAFIARCNTALNQKTPDLPMMFLPGMFASVTVEQPPIAHVITLPSTAISYSLYGNSVYVIEPVDKSKTLRVRRVFVTTGEQQGNNTVITKGIKAGDQVVSAGELKLHQGARVVINNRVSLHDIPSPDAMEP